MFGLKTMDQVKMKLDSGGMFLKFKFAMDSGWEIARPNPFYL